MARIKIKDHPHLVKDGAVVINTNHDAFLAYHKRKKYQDQKDQEHEEMKERLAKLESLLEELTKNKKV